MSIELFITELDGATISDRCWSESILFEYSGTVELFCSYSLSLGGRVLAVHDMIQFAFRTFRV